MPLRPAPSRRTLLVATLVACWLPAWVSAQTAAAPIRLRGTIESIAADRLVMKERGGERVELALAPNLVVTEIFPVGMDTVTPNSFVGVGAMPQADGTQRAIAVYVFPEAMRGTGEGHRPFDFLPQSTMTNATVAGQATAADGNRLTLAYPGGEKTIVVAPGTPIVSLRPGSRELLVPGARISVAAQVIGEKPTATRISAGRNGFAPPY